MNWSCLHKVRWIFNLDLEFKHSFAAIVNEIFYKTFKYVVKYLKPLNMHALKTDSGKITIDVAAQPASPMFSWSFLVCDLDLCPR